MKKLILARQDHIQIWKDDSDSGNWWDDIPEEMFIVIGGRHSGKTAYLERMRKRSRKEVQK